MHRDFKLMLKRTIVNEKYKRLRKMKIRDIFLKLHGAYFLVILLIQLAGADPSIRSYIKIGIIGSVRVKMSLTACKPWAIARL